MKKKILRRDGSTAWCGDIKATGTSEGNLGAAVIAALAAGANMSDADMSGADMSDANMRDANMRNANMSGADMSGANMRNANMSDADMSDADMSYANMRNANMRNANIETASFKHADMRYCWRSDDAKLAHLNVCDWPVTIQFDGIHIGCKKFTLDEIMNMTEARAAEHHSAAPIRWRRWGKALQALAQATLVNNKPEPETIIEVAQKPKRTRKVK